MEYKVFDLSLIEKVVGLLNLCFPKKNISAVSFVWKHIDEFFNDKSLAMVAVDGDKVCAFVCFTPTVISRNDKKYENFYSCAVQATHPDYRRRGLVSDLTQLIEKRLGSEAQYLGFSNEDGVKIDKFSKKIAYEILGQMATKYFLSWPHKTSLKVKSVKELPLKIAYNSARFGILKNREYLEWRYEKNSKIRYKYLEVRKGAAIQGYIICKKHGIKYEVSELLLKNDSVELYKEAIKAFSGFSLSQGVVLASYSFLQNKFWSQVFPSGSLTKKVAIYFTVKTPNQDLKNSDNWIIQGGDIQ